MNYKELALQNRKPKKGSVAYKLHLFGPDSAVFELSFEHWALKQENFDQSPEWWIEKKKEFIELIKSRYPGFFK